ncbi:hypothetical protein [Clostridium sporogenes]|uniref:hypothetical protein n=1 Tax=Clostridium sporogenes TaxID=1509 RepID=UPI0013D060EE|nr:hypothetical protein [Clostridium sporogenes]NFH40825.1 hypothetical protein [Clostridium sporogenes]
MANNKEQTKGNFRIKGIITGLGNQNAYREGTTKKGDEYKTIKFGVKTSPINKIDVELFAMKPDFIYPYSSKDKKALKIPYKHKDIFKEEGYFEKHRNIFKDTKVFSKKSQLFNPKKDHIDSYHVVGISLSDEKGRESFIDYEAPEKILEMFKDGDIVFISGELKPNTFVNKQGIEVYGVKANIGSIKKESDIDFESKDFQEISAFEQDVIITDTYREENKTILNCYTIGYGDKIDKLQLSVHDDKTPKMAKKFEKLKFGDYMKFQGLFRNEAEQIIIEEESEEDEFGSIAPAGFNNNASTKYNSELVITAVAKNDDGTSCYQKQKYTREDFVEDEIEEYDDISLDDLDEEAPNGINEGEDEEIEDEDDLPF